MARAPSPTTATTQRPRRRRGGRETVAAGRRDSVVGVERGIQLDSLSGPGEDLDRTGLGVAPEEQARRAGERCRLAPPRRVGAVKEEPLGAGRDVEPRLDHAVVAEADPDSGVGAEQAALTDAHHLPAAA